MLYHFTLSGGLGDCFIQLYRDGHYAWLEHMGKGDCCVVDVISHNPGVCELFAWHPARERIVVRSHRYYDSHTLQFDLPWGALPAPAVAGPLTYYPSPEDLELIGGVDRPYVVFSASAGYVRALSRNVPAALVDDVKRGVLQASLQVVHVGRTYPLADRVEEAPSAGGANLIDRLSVPGMARLVQGAAGVVCCHSAVNILAGCERIPQLLLYPQHVKERHFTTIDLHSACADYAECVHGTFEEYKSAWLERFLAVVKSRLT